MVEAARNSVSAAIDNNLDDPNAGDLYDPGSLHTALIERANDGIAIIQDRLLVFANARLGVILDAGVDELVNSPIEQYIHPDELERVLEIYNRRIAGEKVPAVYETAVLRKDGTRVDVEVNAGIIRYHNRPADFIFLRDITERKKAEAKLRSSEEQFRSLVENLSDMVFVIDRDTTIKFETPSITKNLGYPPGYVIGRSALDFVHPDDLKNVRRDLEEVLLSDGSSVPSEFRLRSADGSWIHVEAVGSNRLNTPGVEGVVVTVRAITARKQAEEELTHLMEHNRRIVQNVTEGIILQDTHGYINFSNPAALNILGYETDELEGLHWTAIIPKDQHAKVLAARKRREQGETDSYELSMVRKDGRRITAWVSGVSLMEQGKFLGTMAVFSDITTRKLTEMHIQRLLEQQIAVNRLALRLGNLTDPEQIFETTSEMVKSLMDADAFIVSLYDSDSKQVRFGYARVYGESFRMQDLPMFNLGDIGHGVQRAVLESGQATIVNDYRQSLQNQKVPGDMIAKLSPGHRSMLQLIEIYTRSVMVVPMNVGGETIGVVLVHSRQKNAYDKEKSELLSALANITAIAIQNASLLEKARHAAEQVDQIMQTVPDGMLLLDNGRKLVTANRAAEMYLNALAEYAEDGKLMRLGDKQLGSLLVQNPGGIWHEVSAGRQIYEVDARPMVDGPVQGGWVLVIRDVTQERETSRRIQQQDRLATVGQLAAGIAHDFNNIMSTIVLYAQMSNQSPWVSSKDRERMATIYHQAMHATELIRQILDFSRRSVLERQPLSLRPLVKEQVRLFERTLAENIRIVVDGMAKRCVVNADPTRIQQVMMNLALNARDAMPEGGTLRIGLDLIEVSPEESAPLPEMHPGPWVRLTMGDTGVGINPENMAHIFEPFYTTKGRGEGTGLGLAQVYGIVSQHDGYIDVKSTPGKGTTFSIYLPALPENLSLSEFDTGPLVRGREETVLVVEDSPFTRQALVDSLESLNYHTLTASNGREALEMLTGKSQKIDLVLSDVIMPEMSGLALVREINERGIEVRTVLLTGHFPGREMEALRERGLVELIEKPPSLEKLSEVLGRMLAQQR